MEEWYTKIWVINRVDNVNWPPYRDWKADVSSVSPSSVLFALHHFQFKVRLLHFVTTPSSKTRFLGEARHDPRGESKPLMQWWTTTFSIFRLSVQRLDVFKPRVVYFISYLHLDFINLILKEHIEIFRFVELFFTMSKLSKRKVPHLVFWQR